jgi:voltage-gated potassium channel
MLPLGCVAPGFLTLPSVMRSRYHGMLDAWHGGVPNASLPGEPETGSGSDSKRPDRPPELDGERDELLERVSQWTELPMVVLGFAWLVLVIVDLTRGLSPTMAVVNQVIWGTFIAHFLLEFSIAPKKLLYLRRNVLTLVALGIPALRVARVVRLARVFRAARGVRLLRVVTSANRGMRAAGRVMGRRGLGYVILLTLIVNLLGGAGILAFEREVRTGPIEDFGSALWWTAMMLTTMGSDYYPRSPEGRILALMLAIYAFTVFGYVTASLASLFMSRDVEEDAVQARREDVEALRVQVVALTQAVERIAGERIAGEHTGGEQARGDPHR